MAEEVQCPDCDSVKINPFVSEGDGKCSTCHGTGAGSVWDHIVAETNPFDDEEATCPECDGTGQCQTCGGTGVVEE